MPLSGAYFTDRSQEIGMAEVILPADLGSHRADGGRRQIPHPFRADGGRPAAAALSRTIADLLNEKLTVGDTLLLIGPWKDIEKLQSDSRDLVIIKLPTELDEVLPVPGKAPHALVCLALVVALMVSGLVPNVQAALIGCLLMGALGCVNLTSAYRSIDWKTLVLIVGMLPFSIALQRTGGVDMAADGLRALTSEAGDARHPRNSLRHHGAARDVHLQHGDGGADGAGRCRGGEGDARLALSVRDDCGARGVYRLHDPGVVAGEYAGG